MKGLIEDLRHALRLYRRTPVASAMVVLVLAIGMAFVAAFLSLYSDLLLRPEPGFERGGGRIVSVGVSDGKRNAGGLPAELIDRMAEEVTTLEALAGSMPQAFKIGSKGEFGIGELVTKHFFDGLKPKMVLGRGFTLEEHDAAGDPVVVISWQYWQDQFGGTPDVLGKILEIEGQQRIMISNGPGAPPQQADSEPPPRDFRIVGVMSPEFTGTLPADNPQTHTRFWMPVERGLPMSIPPMLMQQPQLMLQVSVMRGIGRLKPGTSTKAVIRELEGRYAQEEFLRIRPGAKYEVIDRIVQNIFIQRSTEKQLRLFLGGSALLALVAAANVSLFLLARAPGRRRELGIRMAVGAPLKRLARQLATEAALLVAAGGAIGIVLSIWLAKFLRGLAFLRQAQWYDVTLLDWRVLMLVALFLLLLALLVSLAPIQGLKKLGIAASSRMVAARATIAQRIAGTAQVTAAGVLGGAALAFTWHLAVMLFEYPGFRSDLYAVNYFINTDGPDDVVSARIGTAVETVRRREAFAAIPGVTRVAMGTSAPGMPSSAGSITFPDPAEPGNPRAQVRVNLLTIDSNYVDLLGRRLLPGSRNLKDGEAGAVLVNVACAERLFGRSDVVGELLPTRPGRQEPGMQIVGVLENVPYGHPLADPELAIFTADNSMFGGNVIFESTLPAAVLQKQFQEVARTLGLSLNGNVMTLADARSTVLAPDRARGLLTIFTAALVMLLAAFGFYGTQRYLVAAGRREYAIRASLGAGPRALGRLVQRRGMMLGLPGLVLSLPLTYILVAWLRDNYVSREVSPLLVTLVVITVMLALLLGASIGPARLARRTQPAPLLRED